MISTSTSGQLAITKVGVPSTYTAIQLGNGPLNSLGTPLSTAFMSITLGANVTSLVPDIPTSLHVAAHIFFSNAPTVALDATAYASWYGDERDLCAPLTSSIPNYMHVVTYRDIINPAAQRTGLTPSFKGSLGEEVIRIQGLRSSSVARNGNIDTTSIAVVLVADDWVDRLASQPIVASYTASVV
jgi:hypothetical protein